MTDTDYMTKLNREYFSTDPEKSQELKQFRNKHPHIELSIPEMKSKITVINRTIGVLKDEINIASDKIQDLLEERKTLQCEIDYNKKILKVK
jgi:chromosome segregation ATPase